MKLKKTKFYYTVGNTQSYYEDDHPVFEDDFVIDDPDHVFSTIQEYKQALEGCEWVLRQSPTHRLARLYRFVTLYNLARFGDNRERRCNEALKVFYNALSDDPDNQNDRAYWLRAHLYFWLGDRKEAEWALQRSLECAIQKEVEPNNEYDEEDMKAINRCYGFYRRGRGYYLWAKAGNKEYYQLALNDFECPLVLVKNTAYHDAYYADTLIQLHRYHEAYLAYGTALENDPNNKSAEVWKRRREWCKSKDTMEEEKNKKKKWGFF